MFFLRNLKQILFLLLFVGQTLCYPQGDSRDAYIVKYDNDNDGLGRYQFSVQTSDGFTREETGEDVNEILTVRGSYSYIGPDGKTYVVEYIADENGFQPIGEHLPPAAGIKTEVPSIKAIPAAGFASADLLGSLIGGIG